jgi:hypothetical protein
MFANVRESSSLTSPWALGLLMAAWLVTAGLMWKAYREGSSGSEDRCELVCRGPVAPIRNG